MSALFNLPQHKNCKNCGECCGVVLASTSEVAEIRTYLAKYPYIKSVVNKRNTFGIDCPFRNNEEKKCDIYPVRPLICRMMGVCKGLDCKYGNSAEIEGEQFIKDYDPTKMALINSIRW